MFSCLRTYMEANCSAIILLAMHLLNVDLPLLRCVILSSLSEGSTGSFLSLVPFLPS